MERLLFGLPAAWHGSSDPFDCFSVAVTPLLNSSIAYVRDTIIPALYMPPWVFRLCRAKRSVPAVVSMSNELIMGARLAKQDCRAGLDPELLPLWIASRMLALLPHLPPKIVRQLKRLYLEAQGPSMQRVRRGIATSDIGCLNPGDIWFVACFFRMACFENDVLAARAHAQALQMSKLHLAAMSQVRLHLVLMYNDAEYALAQMRRTHLRPEDGVNQSVRHLWLEVEETLLPLPNWDRIPDCVENNVVQMAMGRIRRIFMIMDRGWALYAHRGLDFADKVYAWMATRMAYDKGALVNRCLDLLEYKALIDEVMSDGRRYTEVAIALTLCYIIKKSIFVCEVDGVDLTDTSHAVMPRIAQNLELAMDAVTPLERVKYQQAWLWVCFVGAHHEARAKLGMVRRNATVELGWFQDKLIQMTVGMSWEEVKAVLDKFVFMSFLDPEPEGWFQTVL